MPKRSRKKCPVESVIAEVTGLSHDGRGIAHVNGKTTFLLGALPGESVSFRYQQMFSRHDEGQVVDVLKPSVQRDTPRCAHFGVCGGCSLQHVKSDVQIQQKQEALLDLLKQQAHIQPEELLPPITANAWGYRRKARISVKFIPKKDKVLVGFRERNGRFVANIDSCDILHPSIGNNITAFSNLFYQLKIRHEIPQLEIAVGDNSTAIIIRHLVEMPSDDLALLRQFATEHHYQLYLQPGGEDSIHLDWPKDSSPALQYSLPLYGLTLAFKPQQFIQVNSLINEQMVKRCIELLELQPTDQVLDLFCGIGNFSLPIAKHCEKVIGVEGSTEAMEQAAMNAQLNSIKNAEFYSADLFTPPFDKRWSGQRYHKIVLDPPRAGAKELLDTLPAWDPTHIVYISCNPATLARDAKLLHEKGYTLKKAGVMDMFPHTQHVEAIALFIKGKLACRKNR